MTRYSPNRTAQEIPLKHTDVIERQRRKRASCTERLKETSAKREKKCEWLQGISNKTDQMGTVVDL